MSKECNKCYNQYYDPKSRMCVTRTRPPKQLIKEWFMETFNRNISDDPNYFEEWMYRFELGEGIAVSKMDKASLKNWKRIRKGWHECY